MRIACTGYTEGFLEVEQMTLAGVLVVMSRIN